MRGLPPIVAEAKRFIQINGPQDQRDISICSLISKPRRLHMCRLSLIVTVVTLLLAGSASAAHRAGFWGGRYCLQGQDWGFVPGDRFGHSFLLWD
jgi:hypothetical protein